MDITCVADLRADVMYRYVKATPKLGPMKIVRFLTLAAAMTMTIVPHSTYAQAGGSHEQLEQMFANISQKTSWDMSKKMLLGYYFANPTREPLELASRELSEMGY